jgi:hypothetical protein
LERLGKKQYPPIAGEFIELKPEFLLFRKQKRLHVNQEITSVDFPFGFGQIL